MAEPANILRGEVGLQLGDLSVRLRPTFARLLAAEGEVGSLLGVLERVSAGDVRLAEMVALFWHSLDGEDISRSQLEEAVLEAGMAACLSPFRRLLLAIFKGPDL